MATRNSGRRPKQPNRTVTSRFFKEKSPLLTMRVSSPFLHPPENRRPIGRLGTRGPSAKLDITAPDLAQTIDNALPDAICFLDTNVFSKPLDQRIWDALFRKQILLSPSVWKEMLPWLKTPFHNQDIRNAVVASIKRQCDRARPDAATSAPTPQSPAQPRIDVVPLDDTYLAHGYDYYSRLLILRKAIGPIAVGILTKRLGRPPTEDEFLAEVQGQFGERAFQLAKKGRDFGEFPHLADEELVVMATLTAILRGSEVLIITRDADVHEQHIKLVILMKEHYRAMLAADKYFADPANIAFREVPYESEPGGPPEFIESPLLRLDTTDAEFDVLPPTFNFVNVYCLLLGGDNTSIKVTSSTFCAETEMAT